MKLHRSEVYNKYGINNFDIIRSAACIGVVGIHVSGFVKPFLPIGCPNWWFAQTFNVACRCSVPIFIILSGALLLKPGQNESLKIFWIKRLQRVGLPLLSGSAIYYLWNHYAHGIQLSLRYIAKTLIAGKPYFHLYFLFLISGLYLVTPILRIYLKSASKRDCQYFILTSFILAILYSIFIHFLWKLRLIEFLNAVTLFIPFIGYFLMGSYIRHNEITWRTAGSSLLFSMALLITVLGGFILEKNFGRNSMGLYLYNYLSPTVIMMSVLWYLILQRIGPVFSNYLSQNGWMEKMCYQFSRASLGIYILHPLILEVLDKRCGLSAFSFTPWLGILIITLITTVLSFAIVLLVRRIPYLRYLFG